MDGYATSSFESLVDSKPNEADRGLPGKKDVAVPTPLQTPKRKKPQQLFTVVGAKTRQRPTFPGVPGIIGSEGLNDRVRDGNGCDPLDIITER